MMRMVKACIAWVDAAWLRLAATVQLLRAIGMASPRATTTVAAPRAWTRRTGLRAAAMLAVAALCAPILRAQNSDTVRRPWPAGKPVPDLPLTDAQGKPWRLRDLKGQPVLLNFWASWCEPCRAEMPSLELAAQRFERDGLQVLAINFRETDGAVQKFLDLYPMSLPVLRDRDGAFARAWGVHVFPTTLLIDRRGQVRALVNGEVDWTGATAKAWIAELL